MLDIAIERGHYKEVKALFLLKDPLPEHWIGRYDVIVSAGLMTHDHCGPDVIDEKIKCLKPGGKGIFMFTTRPIYMDSLGYQKKLDELTAAGKIEHVTTLKFTRYYNQEGKEVKDERFKPCEVGNYVYRVKWT